MTAQTSLRILAADADVSALEQTARMLEALGHEVTAMAVDVETAAEQVVSEDPDLSVVVMQGDDEHALGLIAELNACASGPVIALLSGDDPDFVRRAAERGIHAYARVDSPADLESAIALALERRSEETKLAEQVDQLTSALDRRAIIERAKGILMERHGVRDDAAFEMLRGHARANNRTVVDCAKAVIDGHGLLPARP